MLKMYTAATLQIDSPEDAVAEIAAQLKDKPLLKNTIGIVGCRYDYIETGTVQELRKVLPFDLIGCSVFGNAVNSGGGTEQLSLAVLTSDDLTFASVFSDDITAENYSEPVNKAYDDALEILGGDPSFIFILGPITTNLSGDQILESLNKHIGGNIPIFGTLSNDASLGFTKSYVFKNGEVGKNKAVLLLLKGEFKPRFHTASLSEKNIQRQNAVITESTGYLVSKINDIPLLEYFIGNGIIQQSNIHATIVPLMADYGDGTQPFANSMYGISEKGAFCGSKMPVGTMFSLATVDNNSVMETCEKALQSALADVEKNGANGMIAIPCFTRPVMLTPNINAELKKTLEIVGTQVPFALFYSGGEICPVYDKKNALVNRFHHMTYTLVVF
ncbi:hypothetical protein FACS189427_02960 [Planctomycetales bacterium]|nr:hypothetical protein FACS189427_02960 [Planctomycetales bacterium]